MPLITICNGNANIYDTPWGTAKQVKATVPSSGKQLKSIDNLKVGNRNLLTRCNQQYLGLD